MAGNETPRIALATDIAERSAPTAHPEMRSPLSAHPPPHPLQGGGCAGWNAHLHTRVLHTLSRGVQARLVSLPLAYLYECPLITPLGIAARNPHEHAGFDPCREQARDLGFVLLVGRVEPQSPSDRDPDPVLCLLVFSLRPACSHGLLR